MTLVIGREINPPEGEEPALWLLLTTHQVNDVADARRIIGFYRLRWTIEQLFRTMKTKGFAVEALRQEQDGPLEKLVAAILIAAVKVMQLVDEREGKAKRPLGDVFDPDDRPALERVCQSLEGKTAKQKNPHPRRLPRLRRMGLRKARRMDRLLRQTRPHRHAQRPDPVPRH